MKFRILIIILGGFIALSSCKRLNKNDKKEVNLVTEKFDDFYLKFYSDSSFQKNRIVQPLMGKVLEWHEEKDSVIESDWKKNELTFISDLKNIKSTIENSIWEITDSPSSRIEKLYIKNSGFFIEREFKVKDEKWYLIRYDISNL